MAAASSSSSSASPQPRGRATAYTSSEAGSGTESDDVEELPLPKAKKQRTTTTPKAKSKSKSSKSGASFAFLSLPPAARAGAPPTRPHAHAYHASLLLASEAAQEDLLGWYAGVAEKRSMPWRKAWLDPSSYTDAGELREALKQRAYGVWISEIMLQQTRVETVIPYYNTWLARWPTIEALAAASPDDVLACWKGLGYYSRATRLQGAAKDMVSSAEYKGLLPGTPEELVEKVQGVGPYTAGAISAIAFGVAAPMVDGNVVRVLSRQIGLYASPKLSSTAALITEVATRLVQAISRDADGELKCSARPGAWGQALMELGATVCKPKPECGECPISGTCRAYAEGEALAVAAGTIKNAPEPKPLEDIEDLCALCEPLEEADEAPAKKEAKSKAAAKAKADAKQPKLSFGAPIKNPQPTSEASTSTSAKPSAATLDIIIAHASRFPMKVIKAAVREEECAVCVIRDEEGKVLIAQRPDKGLLASLWEFPALIVPTGASKRATATAHAVSLLPADTELHYEAYHGSVVHLFSHIRLTMHVHAFTLLGASAGEVKAGERRKWIADVERESLSTGNVRCWELVTGQGEKKGKSAASVAEKKRKR